MVSEQTYKNFEVVVVDDGSQDETAEILSSYTDNRLRFVPKEHSGAPKTRNRCIDEARGEYLLWLDSDDVLLPGAIEAHVAALKATPDANVFYGNVILCDQDLVEQEVGLRADWYGLKKELTAGMFEGDCIPNPGTMVHSSLYKRFGGYNESFPRAHDYEFWCRVLKAASFKHVGTELVKYRLHGSNISGDLAGKDTSYEAKIIQSLVERYSLEQLFPDIDWFNLPPEWSESMACLRISQKLYHWQDLEGALKYIEKSHRLLPSPEGAANIAEMEKAFTAVSTGSRETKIIRAVSA